MNKLFNLSLLTRTIKLAQPYKRQFYLSVALAITVALLNPLSPYLIQYTVDNEIMTGDYAGLTRMIVIMIGVLLFQTLVQYSFIFMTRWLGQSVIEQLRTRVFNHITKQKLKYFDNTPIGTATTRTINDVETINDIFAQGIITIIADLLALVAVIVVMFVTNWRLALTALALVPVMLFAMYVFKEGVKKSFQAVRTQVSKMNAFLQEHISGMKVVQIFTAEDRENAKFEAINQDYRKANIKAIWYYSIFFPVVEILMAIATGLVVWVGANTVLQEYASLGSLIAFLMYINLMFRPLRMMADKFNTVQMGLVASERVFKLLDEEERIADEGMRPATNLKGSIEFKNVWFAYNSDNYVLKDVSFKLNPGETLAIVGATGSGKSTTINIVNRFYEIAKGQVLIDGVPFEEYELTEYRSNIGNVLQDVFLFSGTIMENITLRNKNMTAEEVVEAAKICGIHEFIEKLPGQYEYDVMERGSTLSLGQRQLISFIRTLVYNPSILIMDEATSSIDRESELLIQQATEKLVKERTSIIIAHRLSTIKHADMIMVLDNGEVQEIGTHEALLKKENGAYRKLYEMQFQSQELNDATVL